MGAVSLCPGERKYFRMGNICSKKIPPVYEAKTVSDLAQRVYTEKFKHEKVGDVRDVRALVDSSCAGQFWRWWRLGEKDERGVEVSRMTFLYLVISTWLEGSRTSDRGLTLEILTHISQTFFTDPDKLECLVPFQDVAGKVLDIFTGLDQVLAPVNGVVTRGVLDQVVENIIFLRTDPLIRDELEPSYKMFLKEMSLKSSRKMQQCLLSLL